MFTHLVCLSSAALVGFITCHYLWKIEVSERVIETEKPWKEALAKEKKSRRDWEDKWASADAAHLKEVEQLAWQIKGKENQIDSLESAQKVIAGKLAYDDEQIALLQAQIEQLSPLEAQLSLKESKIQQMEAEASALQKQIPVMEIQICQLRSEKEAALSQLRTRTTELKELETALKEKKAKIAPIPAPIPVAEEKAPLTPPVAVVTNGTKVTLAKPQAFVKDDLKLIKGIGPKTEKLLNKMSIYRFKQIAQWSNNDVEFFSSKLGTFQNRIQENNWISNAKKEHLRKYGKKA